MMLGPYLIFIQSISFLALPYSDGKSDYTVIVEYIFQSKTLMPLLWMFSGQESKNNYVGIYLYAFLVTTREAIQNYKNLII